jgi:hypothetical protein
MLLLLVACGQDPEVARLSAEVAELKARVETLEARPAFPEVEELLEQVTGLIGDATDPVVPSESTSPIALPLSILDDPAMWESCRLLLHRGPDGEYDGFRLSEIRMDSLPHQAGLKNGDLVTAVHGRPVRSMTEARAALEAVTTEKPSQIVVELNRRGSPMTVTIPVAPEGSESEAEREARREQLKKRLVERRRARQAEAQAPAPSP